jgi:uncharacterized Zn-finger protein
MAAPRLLSGGAMASNPYTPEIAYVTVPRVACDGATEISPALGHPRVYMQIDEKGFVDCGYCDKRFILKGGPADEA